MTRDFENLLGELESDTSLLEPRHLGRRIEALDRLDFAEFDVAELDTSDGITFHRASSIRNRLETANDEIYESIRRDIQTGNPASLLHWIKTCGDPGQSVQGLGYDVLDELIAGVLPLPEPDEVVPGSAEQVFYQPTPVRHMLDMIQRTSLSPDDVLVDFGSGLGQFCIVASILTGARSVGIEIEGAYVECARRCAQNLGLDDRVSFIQADARQADLSAGTVFHLYTPFTGTILRSVLDRLREHASRRPIRITTLGPCTGIVVREPWLRTNGQAEPDRIVLFQS